MENINQSLRVLAGNLCLVLITTIPSRESSSSYQHSLKNKSLLEPNKIYPQNRSAIYSTKFGLDWNISQYSVHCIVRVENTSTESSGQNSELWGEAGVSILENQSSDSCFITESKCLHGGINIQGVPKKGGLVFRAHFEGVKCIKIKKWTPCTRPPWLTIV